MPRALLSVYDKTNLIDLATTLLDLGWELVASGGTEQTLQAAGLTVTPVEQLTNQPEILSGRVKTLHPAIHAGILARDTTGDLEEIAEYGFAPINMVVCNLYPFRETVRQAGTTLQDAIEQIDIGGVTLLRGAAKNFLRVITVYDPEDYARVAAALRASGEVDLATRRELAAAAFSLTRDYDAAIHTFLSQDVVPSLEKDDLPEMFLLNLSQSERLRYGENPHQQAAYYSRQENAPPLGAQQLGGKQLSYNNILDVDAAWRCVSNFYEPTVVIVKHLTPTGIASEATIEEAYPHALNSDPISAFGGIIAANRVIDRDFVEVLGSIFLEAIVAPDFTEEAQEMMRSGRKNCRLLKLLQPYDGSRLELRSVQGGMLIQQLDMGDEEQHTLNTVTKRAPTFEELKALHFSWKAVQHVKSNAIVLAKSSWTVGIGGGLPSRVDAVHLAASKASEDAMGSVMASDAFFPFPDGLEAAADVGVTAIIQPGGSIRDRQAIEAADARGIAMVFTGTRHFRH